MKCLILFTLLCMLQWITHSQGCHYYRDGEGGRKRRQALDYTADETTLLRNYFTGCMTSKNLNPIYDWRSIVDFTVLDSLWHLNTLQTYCSSAAGGSTGECWRREIGTFLRTDEDNVLVDAKSCISDFAEDAAKVPPVNRYASVLIRSKRQTSDSMNTTVIFPAFNGSDRLPTYDACLNSTTAFRDVRDPIRFNQLSFFIERNTIDLCNSDANTESFVTVRWPYRFVALTRPDTDLREPLESCALRVFTPDSFWSDWSGWTSCSKTCGEGYEIRRRTCRFGKNPREESEECLGSGREIRLCNLKKCPIVYHYYYGQWSTLGRCSKTCGSGQRYRTRECYRSDHTIASVSRCIGFGRARQFAYCHRYPCYHYYHYQHHK